MQLTAEQTGLAQAIQGFFDRDCGAVAQREALTENDTLAKSLL